MLPHYPNNPHRHHHHCVYHHQQEQQPFLPNPTAAAAFLMPATASWDGYGGGQTFPGDMYNQQGTLEAVLRQPVTAAPRQDQAVDGAGVVRAAVPPPRKRPLRTDRHSKIRTAQGVRDRRMRLSVGVARDFFALQDRLGFDKASKTVNWLLTQSKPAIDSLRDAAAVPPPAASTAVKETGGGSSSTTVCFREKGRNRGGPDGPAAALMEEDGGCDLDWIMSEAAAAAAETTELPQPMDGLEFCYQYYQLEEMMMRCNNGGDPR